MTDHDAAFADVMRLKRAGVRPVGRPVTFFFDRQRIEAIAGETMASALAAQDIVTIREDRPGEWRGLYCGMGACFECVVTIDGRVGQRACMTKLRGGEDVRSTPPTGTPDDPVRPLAKAAVGTALPERRVDVLVIGAGPGGLSAALAARRTGASVIVLDERSDSGGQYYKPIATSHRADVPPDRQFRDGDALLTNVRAAGAELLHDVTVFGAFARDEVLALVDGKAVVFRPRRLILATGAHERPMPFPGWTLPGVMTTGALQTLARSQQVVPGKRVVVAGNGPLNFQLAADLISVGVDVVAVVESARRPGLADAPIIARAAWSDSGNMIHGADYLFRLRRAGVPVFWSHAAVEAHGDRRVEALDIAPLDAKGRPDLARRQRLAADVVGLGYGFIASTEVARALGCRMRWDERHLGSLAVDVSDTGATSIDGVFAVGDGAHVAGAAVAMAKGELAGMAAARELSLQIPSGETANAERRLEISSSVYFETVPGVANRQFLERFQRRFPDAGPSCADVEASYIAVLLLARAIRLAGTAEMSAVRAAVADLAIDAPQGRVFVDPDNRHCYLTPRIGVSNENFGFDLIYQASGPIKPDPYLVWSEPRPAPRMQPQLRVVE